MAMSSTALDLHKLSGPGMMPPPLILATHHKFILEYQCSPPNYLIPSPGGPAIHVPSTWQKVPQPLPPGSSGYSAQHRHYAAQCECWGRMAHNPPPAETILLEISAVFEAGGKKKNLHSAGDVDTVHQSLLSAVLLDENKVMSGKCHHHHTSSTSSGSTPVPPQKKFATTFSSPDPGQIKETLQTGGACNFDVRTDFYAIPTCDIDDLVNKKAAFDIWDAKPICGNI
ncbi:hypothetical protein PISMIDRAFT_25262 [Pisolithus microcarpus 441]|uniref:Uncharacterized protein n=1 Tax=Pisolithus microcarpus 441 TaxID=765257 RepID=A0A0C9YPE1_9AGAM|nr:hypothetical protein BKA83DRAFT_25262 [Pisolithus microcarpus]KIK15669.1 hypothetical protein PISMIDRAFT_25262 [Pisolithus microcarpus 441]